jgi:hypothetical protein
MEISADNDRAVNAAPDIKRVIADGENPFSQH